MKILNIFKKKTKTANANTKKLDKKQLEKVIGGADSTSDRKSGAVVAADYEYR
ncbi:MAG: hypothetical protein U0W65_04565 [Bacteroidia bacterium]|nr:hypothetical protein [Bacteroidia bacterium]